MTTSERTLKFEAKEILVCVLIKQKNISSISGPIMLRVRGFKTVVK